MKPARSRAELLQFTAFVLPALVVIAYAFLVPFLMNVYFAFTDWNGIQSKPGFIGWDNFVELFTDDRDFGSASWFTVVFTAVYVVSVNGLALLLAVILDQNLKSRNVLRAAIFIPYILSLVVVGFLWKFIFTFGFDSLGAATGWSVFQNSWLSDRFLSFVSITSVSVWQSVGFFMVIYIAGLQSIPAELIEAAKIDGASSGVRFQKVVVPLLLPAFTSCFFYALVSGVRVFDVIVSLTGGGPGRATASVTYDIYTEAFANNRYGYGTAKSLVMFLVVGIIVILQVNTFKRREVEA